MRTRILTLGDTRPDEEALSTMRTSPANKAGTKWAAYQNQDLGHVHLGHLRFLAVGPRNTLRVAPARHPDLPEEILWRYIFVGWVDLDTGAITVKRYHNSKN
jgi:hypothetical protein